MIKYRFSIFSLFYNKSQASSSNNFKGNKTINKAKVKIVNEIKIPFRLNK